ncbi:hypothetical protein Pcinc_001361 [Petrolisthes cinctipes]|uniref:Uncharacterized protein n=1 Tax=Petrolisthes cinctipes TaxID=88211 RepID=A0AAE1GKA4_PETCI|nr:hypothetical protein Pcinc_001361 [Petrolisthes cinctipes]
MRCEHRDCLTGSSKPSKQLTPVLPARLVTTSGSLGIFVAFARQEDPAIILENGFWHSPNVFVNIYLFSPGNTRANLCCVDKKGVLSWPNPKTEKVFFPQEQSTQPHNYQLVLSPSIGNDAMFEEIKLERNSSLQHNQSVVRA